MIISEKLSGGVLQIRVRRTDGTLCDFDWTGEPWQLPAARIMCIAWAEK
jgi:hypothetical protein